MGEVLVIVSLSCDNFEFSENLLTMLTGFISCGTFDSTVEFAILFWISSRKIPAMTDCVATVSISLDDFEEVQFVLISGSSNSSTLLTVSDT